MNNPIVPQLGAENQPPAFPGPPLSAAKEARIAQLKAQHDAGTLYFFADALAAQIDLDALGTYFLSPVGRHHCLLAIESAYADLCQRHDLPPASQGDIRDAQLLGELTARYTEMVDKYGVPNPRSPRGEGARRAA